MVYIIPSSLGFCSSVRRTDRDGDPGSQLDLFMGLMSL